MQTILPAIATTTLPFTFTFSGTIGCQIDRLSYLCLDRFAQDQMNYPLDWDNTLPAPVRHQFHTEDKLLAQVPIHEEMMLPILTSNRSLRYTLQLLQVA